jgi:anaerobic selenocysteine-containing dehydrogenase
MTKMAVDGFFAALGSTRIRGSVCDGTGIKALEQDFGSLEQGPLEDLKHCQWIINWGRDFARSSIHTQAMVNKARKSGTRVVSIWSGGQGYADFSDQLIRIASLLEGTVFWPWLCSRSSGNRAGSISGPQPQPGIWMLLNRPGPNFRARGMFWPGSKSLPLLPARIIRTKPSMPWPVLVRPQNPKERYPLRLLSLIRKESIHSQILPRDQDMPPQVWVNPEAYGAQDLDLNRDVYLVSELGRLRVQVNFDSTLHPQAVIYRRGDWMKLGGGVNQLIRAELTDLEVGAALYSQRVRLSNEC